MFSKSSEKRGLYGKINVIFILFPRIRLQLANQTMKTWRFYGIMSRAGPASTPERMSPHPTAFRVYGPEIKSEDVV